MPDDKDNERIVTDAFDTWARTGSGILDVLDERVRWTIEGPAPMGKTFEGRKAFVDGAFAPISARFSAPMTPTVRRIVAQGDDVVVFWTGIAPMNDGQTYRNSYAWLFKLRGGLVVEAHAFLDLQTYAAALAGERLPRWNEERTEQLQETKDVT